MAERWRTERVTALAPDTASDVAGRALAKPSPWSDVGWAPPLLWGSCQGSGKTPYQVAVDTSGPWYTCSCPSRKFPCKHVLGLLYLWAEGRVDEGGGIEAYAAEWAAKRAKQEDAAAGSDESPQQTEAQREAAEKRAAQRDERVRTGMAELDRWLADQVTSGLAATTRNGYGAANEMAARMVDAQAPAVAGRLRELALMPAAGGDWPRRVVAELGLLHLLASATTRLEELDDDLRHTVRMRLGYPTARDDVLALPPVADRWAVVGMRDSDEENVSVRRVWLRGMATGLPGLVLLFTPYGQPVDRSLLPGMVVEGDLHHYPGRPKLRALMGRRGPESRTSEWYPPAQGVAEAVAAWRDAVAADPWLTEWPVLVLGAAVVPQERLGWRLVDGVGEGVRMVGTEADLWQLLALSGGHRVPVFGELSELGLRPTSLLLAGELVPL